MTSRRCPDSAALAKENQRSNTRGLLPGFAGGPVPIEVPERTLALAALAGAPSADYETLCRLVADVFTSHGLVPPVLRMANPLPPLVRVKDLAVRYLSKRRGGVSYDGLCRRALQSFVRACGELEVRTVIGQQVEDWAESLLGSRTIGTVTNWIGALSGFFRYAIKMGHATSNPCEFVELGEYSGVVLREPVPESDLERLLAHLQAPELSEWLTLTLNGRYAGLRLQDAARVTGEAVSFRGDACLLDVTARKTGRPDVLPLFGPIVSHLRAIKRPGLLTPNLAGMSADRLGRGFCRLCQEAQIDLRPTKIVTGRTFRRVTFHSLRHSFVTDLTMRGVPQELRKKMSAHVTDSAHAAYDHAGALALHQQVAKYFTP